MVGNLSTWAGAACYKEAAFPEQTSRRGMRVAPPEQSWRSAVPRFRNSQSLLSCALLLGLFLSACSGGSGAPAPTAASGAAATPASQAVPAAPRPTPDQPTGTPASTVNPAAQPA